eukprot:CAMPEP_0180515186 /NCGR_PEP_ID=MMETSP1036_2-20121128/53178_1 /TAXON_ID=632150 /ORGANISM="Azadinium spinosum, Strain 3D9" /LENGTH=109 /DNA_ID=CAMNT_0022526757 /DNA_START=112 /DNA_END=438 /DNA_ORIENTATION=-
MGPPTTAVGTASWEAAAREACAVDPEAATACIVACGLGGRTAATADATGAALRGVAGSTAFGREPLAPVAHALAGSHPTLLLRLLVLLVMLCGTARVLPLQARVLAAAQ